MEALFGLGEKRRADVRSSLQHAVRLNPRYAQHLTGSDAFSTPVEAMLRKRCPCHLLRLGRWKRPGWTRDALREALGAIMGIGNGAFVSCIPGRLGFYEYESTKSYYLLHR